MVNPGRTLEIELLNFVHLFNGNRVDKDWEGFVTQNQKKAEIQELNMKISIQTNLNAR